MEQKNNDDILNDIFNRFKLIFDKDDPKNSDVFVSSRFKIITRSGIDKIESKLKPDVKFNVITNTPYEVAIEGTFECDAGVVTTIGEASVDLIQPMKVTVSITKDGVERKEEKIQNVLLKKGNVGQNPSYIYAIAEKRLRSRAILRLAGLYDQGFYGEDEAEDFGKVVREAKTSVRSI